MSKILLAFKSANVAMDEKLKMKQIENDMASLIPFMNLGSEEVPIEEYV